MPLSCRTLIDYTVQMPASTGRIIMRIEVGKDMPQALQAVIDRNGSTTVATVSRLIEWLRKQDDMLQAAILVRVDVARQAIEGMKDQRKKSKK
jgi:hypothetical protein